MDLLVSVVKLRLNDASEIFNGLRRSSSYTSQHFWTGLLQSHFLLEPWYGEDGNAKTQEMLEHISFTPFSGVEKSRAGPDFAWSRAVALWAEKPDIARSCAVTDLAELKWINELFLTCFH